mmetsp:Transcript_93295/g.204175  ORF Transcript_93295/g.204175 Transcript_93295/m.204175 type:complete len:689 (+) Transcript_93295:3-2069(+)
MFGFGWRGPAVNAYKRYFPICFSLPSVQMGQTCGNCSFSKDPSDLPGASAPRLPPRQRGNGDDLDEPMLPLHARSFQVSVLASLPALQGQMQVGSSSSSSSPTSAAKRESLTSRQGWQNSYSLGPLLGDGVSAKVYQAEAKEILLEGQMGIAGPLWNSCSGISVPPCLRERSRKVAVKRFHRCGSRTYQKELEALKRVGVFPHLLRLLESYQGFEGEDVLVLEYCEGSTLYDLYAREHSNGGLPERLIARLTRQLLLALQHLAACSVEHQDVKPENMMLHDVSVSSCKGELKLGDFGWAAIVAPPYLGKSRIPSSGAGSLWYAPPELNPPVKGVPVDYEIPVDVRGMPIVGKSDMWSVGVVMYLLLVGHNPFNTALRQPTPEAVDNEVLRLVALGQFNQRPDRWINLEPDTKELIASLLQVRPSRRPSATDALAADFVERKNWPSTEPSVFFHGEVPSANRVHAWRRLDGFQRLAWLAVARAVGEPELDRAIVASALEGTITGVCTEPVKDSAYLANLARELATTPVFQWLQDRGAWPDILRIAFAYLDVDADGLLSAHDLAAHVARPMPTSAMAAGDSQYETMVVAANTAAWAQACRWLNRWKDPRHPTNGPLVTSSGAPALGLSSLREALLSSSGVEESLLEAFEAPTSVTSSDKGNHHTEKKGYERQAEEEEISWNDMSHAVGAV